MKEEKENKKGKERGGNISIYITPENLRFIDNLAIDSLAKGKGKSRSQIINEIIEIEKEFWNRISI